MQTYQQPKSFIDQTSLHMPQFHLTTDRSSQKSQRDRSKKSGMGEKLKHWAYNYVKTAQANFNSKTILKLNEQPFFKPVTAETGDQRSQILHERYINRYDARPEQLRVLNDRFSRAFQSITWFTYRDNIEIPLQGSNLKSDSGWGCMLRTGQMLLFQAIKRHHFGDGFNLNMLQNTKYAL